MFSRSLQILPVCVGLVSGVYLNSQLLAGDVFPSDKATTACRVWCEDHVSVWQSKCSWKGCKGCTACEAPQEIQVSLDKTAKSKYLAFLRNQTAVGVFNPVPNANTTVLEKGKKHTSLLVGSTCVDWCGSHVSVWSRKCAWSACGACTPCFDKPSRAHADSVNKDRYSQYLLHNKMNLNEFQHPPSSQNFRDAATQAEQTWAAAADDLASRPAGLPPVSWDGMATDVASRKAKSKTHAKMLKAAEKQSKATMTQKSVDDEMQSIKSVVEHIKLSVMQERPDVMQERLSLMQENLYH